MKIFDKISILIGVIAYLVFTSFLNQNPYYTFIIIYQIYLTLRFINNIGNEICFFDYLIFYSCIDTLLMPIFSYDVYYKNKLALLWGQVMHVKLEVYYSYMIPCNLVMFLALSRIKNSKDLPKIYQAIIEYLKGKGNIGVAMVIVAAFFSIIQNSVPESISTVVGFFSILKYVGPLYIYYSDFKYKNYVLAFSVLFFFGTAIATGMFGEFLNYNVLIFIIIAPRFKIKFYTKFIVFTLGVLFVLILTLIKHDFRDITWRDKEVDGLSTSTHSNSSIFYNLFINKTTNLSESLNEDALFSVYWRLNQGILISRVMQRVPDQSPYADGETIINSLISIVLPRIVFPDKYSAGGAENMRRFLGYKGESFGFTVNIGPYGEMFGNFGPDWGIFFVFLYGLVLYLSWAAVWKLVKRKPYWFLWLPSLFYYVLTVETDIFTCLNSLFKSYLFIYVLLFLISKYEKRIPKFVKA